MQQRATEYARFIRAGLPVGVEALHATFVTHRYAPHVHDAWTVAQVISGAARFQLEGRWHTAPAGTSFLIAPGTVHTGESANPGGYTYRVLYLQRSMTEREPRENRYRGRVPVLLSDSALERALSLVHGILVMPRVALEQGEAIARVWRELLRLLAPAEKTGQSAGVHPAVADARAYIHAHWREDFTLDELGQAVGLSVFHLVRTFHDQIGMPPSSYRRALRIQAAQRLLRSGIPPAHAAVDCGFYDQAHLHRHFKRVTGVTPSRYLTAA